MSTLTFTYLHTYGVHQTASRDSNPYQNVPGTFNYGPTVGSGQRLNPSLGLVDEIYPEAVYKQNQFIVNLNARFTPSFSVTGFYTRNFASGDTGTASNSYNLKQDYGRSSFVRSNVVLLMANYTGKWGISYSPSLSATSGRPFNITDTTDLTGDDFFNQRPSIASSSAACTGSSQYVQTSFGCLDTIPQPGEALLSPNIGNGPASIAVNLRASRSFGIGPKVEAPAGGNRQRGGGGGGFGGGGFGGPGGGGPGGGGGAWRRWRWWWPWRRWWWWRLCRRRWRRWWHVEHRPQVLSHLQRTGVEPIQRHQLRGAERKRSSNPYLRFRSDGHLWSRQPVRQIDDSGRRTILNGFRVTPDLYYGVLLVLRIPDSTIKGRSKCSGLFLSGFKLPTAQNPKRSVPCTTPPRTRHAVQY